VSAISSVTQVACGSKHSVALKTDGSVWAWGNNFDYQLGDGTQVAQSVPKQVAGVSGATQIAASENTTLALLSAGTVMGWGATERGQVGVGQLPSNQNQYYKTPTAVSALSGVT
jgi:alpha-tubulin suppressor-like RCC1 family protein